MNLVQKNNTDAKYPSHPSKKDVPRLHMRIEASAKAISGNVMTVYLLDSVGGRNFDLPINGDDLDASELTWAITKILRQWNGMKV
jgi:hypothetical protein